MRQKAEPREPRAVASHGGRPRRSRYALVPPPPQNPQGPENKERERDARKAPMLPLADTPFISLPWRAIDSCCISLSPSFLMHCGCLDIRRAAQASCAGIFFIRDVTFSVGHFSLTDKGQPRCTRQVKPAAPMPPPLVGGSVLGTCGAKPFFRWRTGGGNIFLKRQSPLAHRVHCRWVSSAAVAAVDTSTTQRTQKVPH